MKTISRSLLLLTISSIFMSPIVYAESTEIPVFIKKSNESICHSLAENTSTSSNACRVMIQFNGDTSYKMRQEIVEAAGAKMISNWHVLNGATVTIDNQHVLNLLASNQHITRIIPDNIVSLAAKGGGGKPPGNEPPPSGGQTVPAGVINIGAAPGQLPHTGAGVGIAVVDTGLDLNNPDLNIARDGSGNPVCYFNPNYFTDCQDTNGHGTYVAGIIAAKNNSIDVVGVAPDAVLYPVKIFNQTTIPTDNTFSYDSDVIAGLDWILATNANASVNPKIRVVNMSLQRRGTLDDNPIFHMAISDLYNAGIVVVTSAGNEALRQSWEFVPAAYHAPGPISEPPGSPTAYSESLVVASTTAEAGPGTSGPKSNCAVKGKGIIEANTAAYNTTDGKYFWFYEPYIGSSYPYEHYGVTISAPGETYEYIDSNTCTIHFKGLPSLALGGGVRDDLAGTSLAAAHVSGVVALILEEADKAGQVLSIEDIRQKIRDNAYLIGAAPYDSLSANYGFDGEREGVLSACNIFNVPC